MDGRFSLYRVFEQWLLCNCGMALRSGDIEWLGWWVEDSNDSRVWRCDRDEVVRRQKIVSKWQEWKWSMDGVGEWVRDGEDRCPCVDVVWYVGE